MARTLRKDVSLAHRGEPTARHPAVYPTPFLRDWIPF